MFYSLCRQQSMQRIPKMNCYASVFTNGPHRLFEFLVVSWKQAHSPNIYISNQETKVTKVDALEATQTLREGRRTSTLRPPAACIRVYNKPSPMFALHPSTLYSSQTSMSASPSPTLPESGTAPCIPSHHIFRVPVAIENFLFVSQMERLRTPPRLPRSSTPH
jgi:hypothetical protein